MKIFRWIFGAKATLVFYGVIAAAGAAFVLGLIQWGRNMESAKCDAKAKQSIIDALQIDLSAANGRLDDANRAIAALQRQRTTSEQAVTDLQKEVDAAKLQSTKKGAKANATALLDDRCNYTARGARRVRQ